MLTKAHSLITGVLGKLGLLGVGCGVEACPETAMDKSG